MLSSPGGVLPGAADAAAVAHVVSALILREPGRLHVEHTRLHEFTNNYARAAGIANNYLSLPFSLIRQYTFEVQRTI